MNPLQANSDKKIKVLKKAGTGFLGFFIYLSFLKFIVV